ncbi:Uncharacterised protein [Bordetella pertussis]|nr:Uncharacterised protein [Bordetella pertussis]
MVPASASVRIVTKKARRSCGASISGTVSPTWL